MGTLLTNDHTVLISYTAGGILSSLTGVYPDRHGQAVSNSYLRTSSTGAFAFPSAFGSWTELVSSTGTATVPNMVTPTGANTPGTVIPRRSPEGRCPHVGLCPEDGCGAARQLPEGQRLCAPSRRLTAVRTTAKML